MKTEDKYDISSCSIIGLFLLSFPNLFGTKFVLSYVCKL